MIHRYLIFVLTPASRFHLATCWRIIPTGIGSHTRPRRTAQANNYKQSEWKLKHWLSLHY